MTPPAGPALADKMTDDLKRAGFDVHRKTNWDGVTKQFTQVVQGVRAGVVVESRWRADGKSESGLTAWTWRDHRVTRSGETVQVDHLAGLYRMLGLAR